MSERVLEELAKVGLKDELCKLCHLVDRDEITSLIFGLARLLASIAAAQLIAAKVEKKERDTMLWELGNVVSKDAIEMTEGIEKMKDTKVVAFAAEYKN